jgi:tryptophan-rich sensory protein
MPALRALFGFFRASCAAAATGGAVARRSVGSWYDALRKPAVSPPKGLFGPVWALVYGAIAVAAWLNWWRGRATAAGRLALRLYGLQLALNALWSVAVFGLRSPGPGLVVIGLLESSIAAWLIASARLDRRAAALIAPYLAWVSFASYLNLRVWQLNRGAPVASSVGAPAT